MKNIIMCVSENCPVRKDCYRYKIKPNKLQSSFNFEYTCNAYNGFCEYIKLTSERSKGGMIID